MLKSIKWVLVRGANCGYLVPYSAAGKRLVKIGAVFDPAVRTIKEYGQAE